MYQQANVTAFDCTKLISPKAGMHPFLACQQFSGTKPQPKEAALVVADSGHLLSHCLHYVARQLLGWRTAEGHAFSGDTIGAQFRAAHATSAWNPHSGIEGKARTSFPSLRLFM
ncbi:hypothetical protein AOLI_G00001410 [Acnodon oligacanthus]